MITELCFPQALTSVVWEWFQSFRSRGPNLPRPGPNLLGESLFAQLLLGAESFNTHERNLPLKCPFVSRSQHQDPGEIEEEGERQEREGPTWGRQTDRQRDRLSWTCAGKARLCSCGCLHAGLAQEKRSIAEPHLDVMQTDDWDHCGLTTGGGPYQKQQGLFLMPGVWCVSCSW